MVNGDARKPLLEEETDDPSASITDLYVFSSPEKHQQELAVIETRILRQLKTKLLAQMAETRTSAATSQGSDSGLHRRIRYRHVKQLPSMRCNKPGSGPLRSHVRCLSSGGRCCAYRCNCRESC